MYKRVRDIDSCVYFLVKREFATLRQVKNANLQSEQSMHEIVMAIGRVIKSGLLSEVSRSLYFSIIEGVQLRNLHHNSHCYPPSLEAKFNQVSCSDSDYTKL